MGRELVAIVHRIRGGFRMSTIGAVGQIVVSLVSLVFLEGRAGRREFVLACLPRLPGGPGLVEGNLNVLLVSLISLGGPG